MTSHSTLSKPGTSRGRSASVPGSVSSSFRQGIWMISFIGDGRRRYRARQTYRLAWRAPRSPGRSRARSRAARAEPLGARRPRRQDRLRAAVRGLRDRVLRLPDVPGLRLVLLAAVGPRSRCTATRSSSTGFRYPTEHPLAIAAGAILQLFGGWGDRLWVALILASFLVLVAGVYRLGRIAAHAARGRGRGGAAADPLRLPVPGRARLHRHPLHGAGRVGGDASRRSRPRRGRPGAGPARAARACCGPRRGSWRRCTGCWVAWKATWRQRFILRGAGGDRSA